MNQVDEKWLAEYNEKQAQKKAALKEKKAAAGRLGAAARQEGLKRAAEAKRVAADKSLDEAGLQAELTKLREELGVITYQQKAQNDPGSTKYTDFLNLGEIVLSGIVWNRKYPSVQDFNEATFDEDQELPLADQKFFRLSPDWCCLQMIRISHAEYQLPDALVLFEIRVFEQFLQWAGQHLKEKLDWLPDIAQELEDRRAGKEMFDQKLHDRIKQEEHNQRLAGCIDVSEFPGDLKQIVINRTPLDVIQTRQFMILALEQKNLPEHIRRGFEEYLRLPPEQPKEERHDDPMVRQLSPMYVPAATPDYSGLPQGALDYLRNGRR